MDLISHYQQCRHASTILRLALTSVRRCKSLNKIVPAVDTLILLFFL